MLALLRPHYSDGCRYSCPRMCRKLTVVSGAINRSVGGGGYLHQGIGLQGARFFFFFPETSIPSSYLLYVSSFNELTNNLILCNMFM